MIDTVGIRPDDTVLEIGAGIGRVGQVVAPLCKEWIGVDVSTRMIEIMRKRLSGHRNVKLIRGTGYDLSGIPDASVDLVYCTVVFMHLEEWDRYRYVLEGMRILKPGGRMYVDNFNLLSDGGRSFFCETMMSYDSLHRPPHISKSSTPQELQMYFQRAAFREIEQKLLGMWIVTYGRKPDYTAEIR